VKSYFRHDTCLIRDSKINQLRAERRVYGTYARTPQRRRNAGSATVISRPSCAATVTRTIRDTRYGRCGMSRGGLRNGAIASGARIAMRRRGKFQ